MTEDILSLFKKTGALFEGHFQLTSGLHSPTYFQCARVLQYPEYTQLLAKKIVAHFESESIDVVISPAIGGIIVGQEVGRQLDVRTIFSEREDRQMKLRRGFELYKNENVLVCEDVVTTGGSVSEVLDLIKSYGAKACGVGIIVDRSNRRINFPVKQYAIIHLSTKTYIPESCPLCRKNLPLQKPGSRDNVATENTE